MSTVRFDDVVKRSLACLVAACVLVDFSMAQTPAPDATDNAPSADTVKAAKAAGYHVKMAKNGTARYCKSEALVGTHFATESCINEVQLLQELAKAQEERDRKRGGGDAAGITGNMP